MTDKLYALAEKTVQALKDRGLSIATAESCTGGTVSKAITAVAGASQVFELGVTSYSCKAKNEVLGVNAETLSKFGAISSQTAKEMALGVRRRAGADIGASVTGAAGPDSSEGHPPGYVFIAVSGEKNTVARLLSIEPVSREYVRERATESLFLLINEYIEGNLNESI